MTNPNVLLNHLNFIHNHWINYIFTTTELITFSQSRVWTRKQEATYIHGSMRTIMYLNDVWNLRATVPSHYTRKIGLQKQGAGAPICFLQ